MAQSINLSNLENLILRNVKIRKEVFAGFLEANSEIVVGKNNAIGTYIGGTAQNVTADANSKFTLGDGSFAFVNMGSGNIINSNITSQDLGNETVYIYSKDKAGTVN